MKISVRLSWTLCALVIGYEGLPTSCTKISIRKEVRQMSQREWDGFVNAFQKLHDTGLHTYLVPLHKDYDIWAHQTPTFFPWHRYYLRIFERRLQEIDPNVVLPYWDWSIDSQSPEDHFAMQQSGGNGMGPENCVLRGRFAGWMNEIPRGCLKRIFNGGDKMASVYSPESLNNFIDVAADYLQFHDIMEYGPHNNVHRAIGGDMGELYSPNDPLFWIHHAYIDKIWYRWQKLHPEVQYGYGGIVRSGNSSEEVSPNASATLCDNLVPFNVPVSSVMDISAPGLCYTYTDSPGDFIRAPFSQPIIPLNKVQLLQNPDYAEIFKGVSALDRTDQHNLRIPKALENEWLEQRRMDIVKTRRYEQTNAALLQKLHQMNYTSPVSLENVESTIKLLIQMGEKYPSPYNSGEQSDPRIPDANQWAHICPLSTRLFEGIRQDVRYIPTPINNLPSTVKNL
ncbi:Di-copper centre-containing protein [Basidiobolus meristosporus CBS 931.73]|uniref:Di-copper centre-containing protein n=1 Tax=Basidiobolus meristosporus CBS 931.73 TaxID=1314790 RepID=A0A1Y1Y3H3_9FUNG|nr:Di-copper centre-containing protein [Basidiobolus meristosporus CBS 931.73]|eukprot:ORX92557.1 Di-copper centre-containing protein [Basidiobolus meristosporus CBS 931.73]